VSFDRLHVYSKDVASSAWFVIKETSDVEQEQRSEGNYGNDKGYGRVAHRREDEAEDLPQQESGW
jgi:hypothetical protein